METKILKIKVPNGYKIYKEKSTYEYIVFKKVDDVVIKWNKNYNGVEIKSDGEHFVLDSNPSYIMGWDDAIRFYNNKHRSHTWNLPTIKQLHVVHKYFNEINNVIEDNGGFLLHQAVYWSVEKEPKFCAWCVNMYNGYTDFNAKDFFHYVRAVSTL
jgi:hypothetical protein